MNKTLLVISLPGTGKTTAAKVLNFAEKEYDRPAIDFDYRGTRFKYDTAAQVRLAQAKLFNAFADQHVRVIFTHWNAVRFDSLNINKFKILFIIPQQGKVQQILNDIKCRDNEDTTFYDLCSRDYGKWISEVEQCYIKAKRRFKYDCFRFELGYDKYVLDALYASPSIWSSYYQNVLDLTWDVLVDLRRLAREPRVEDLVNYRVLSCIRTNTLNHINQFMDFCADNNQKIEVDPYFKKINLKVYHAFYDILYNDIILKRNDKITIPQMLSLLIDRSGVNSDELFKEYDSMDDYLSAFAN